MKSLISALASGAFLVMLSACNAESPAAASAITPPAVAKHGAIVKRAGSWCDAKLNEYSMGHAYVSRDTKDIQPAVETPDGAEAETVVERDAKGVYITYCSPVLK